MTMNDDILIKAGHISGKFCKDQERWQLWAKGEHFPWDAWNYQNQKKILCGKVKLE
jgi:hypothetical protein